MSNVFNYKGALDFCKMLKVKALSCLDYVYVYSTVTLGMLYVHVSCIYYYILIQTHPSGLKG